MSDDPHSRAKSRELGPLRGLLPFLLPYRPLILAAGAALVITAMLSLVLPMAVRRVVDGFSAEQAAQMDAYFAAAVGVAALLAVFTGVRFYFVTRLGERVVADIRAAVYNRVLSMSPAFFEHIQSGEVVSRLTTDTTVIQSVIGSSISVAARNMLMLIGGLVFMALTSLKLTGLVLLLVPLVIVPILTLGRRLRGLSRESQDAIAEASAGAVESLMAVQTIQANTHEAQSRSAFARLTEMAFDAARRRITVRALMTVFVIFLIFTGVVGVLWIGARDVRSEAMSPGELVQFLIYAVMVAGAAAALSEIFGELQRAAGATERLVELLHAQDPISDPASPERPAVHAGAIRFEDVTFYYPSRPGTPALQGAGFEIRPGETVALVGPSGAGKTTVFQLLMRFYEPEAGQISVDGQNVAALAREDLRQAFASVPQEPVMFAATVAENIRFGRPGASDAEVAAAAEAAAAAEFIAALPDGIETFIGERGVLLSGGQKQRIAIARAILRDAPILLLDEATSALDAESERAVQTAVERLSDGRTTLVIAHRLATVKAADRILVFDEGRIVASGTHDALIAEDGLYARLARLQFASQAA